MAESGLDSLGKIREIDVHWRAFELRPGGVFPGTPEEEARYRAYILAKHESMWAIAQDRFGLEMREGPWGVNTRPALEGAYFARQHDAERDYHRACFRAHWQETRRLDKLDVLVDVAQSAGLDADAFREAVTSRAYSAQMDADLALARDFGIQSIPTFIFGNRYLVSGAQPVDILMQVVDRCIAEGLAA